MDQPSFTAFAKHQRLARGGAREVAAAARAALDAGAIQVVILDDLTGAQIELDLRAAEPRLALPDDPGAAAAPRGRGRPRLGVTAREVTLLPRHWEWLAGQPGGASAALRRLVEDASRSNSHVDAARRRRDAAYRAMTLLGGDLPQYEAATRALFRGELEPVRAIVETWPADVAAYLSHLLSDADPARREG